MNARAACLPVLALLTAACAGGAPVLEHRLPSPSELRYDVGDTAMISVSMMGQRLEIEQEATADYAVSFSSTEGGVRVTLTVEEMSASIFNPMGAPLRLNEDAVSGAVVFTLDPSGNATLEERPDVRPEASQVVSGLALAHTFMPALPRRSVAPGDEWVDTVSYEGSESAGRRSETSVLRYSVVGDTTLAGRTVTLIRVEGTSELFAELEIQGMSVSQRSELEVRGEVLWDARTGTMVESRRVSSGRGTVAVPVMPNPIPITVETRHQARLARQE